MPISTSTETDAPRKPASLRARLLRRPLSAGLAGVVAILAGAALAVAPVTMSKTVVEWPADPDATESTVLLLTNQTPYRLDVAFDSTAVSSAAESNSSDPGVVFSTMDPDRGDARALGLVITASGTSLTVASGGSSQEVSTEGVDRYDLSVNSTGLRLEADGTRVIEWPTVPQPQIDAMITDATGIDSSDLSAAAQVVDDPNSSPTPLKIALMVVMWTALAIALVLLRRDDRDPSTGARAPRAPRRRLFRVAVSDVLVIGALAVWVFIGPMTDDDGYYAHMAANYGAAGYVGNYYQMFNEPFTPFTWFWQFLWGWQELGGSSPVWLRVPAFIAAAAAWLLSRALLDRILESRSTIVRRAGRVLLGILFVAWWSAYTIGSRPEGVGALAFIIALTLVLRSLERRTLLPAALGALAAGLAFAAHPTGAVAFAPVLLAVPALWSIARRDGGDIWAAVARTAAVLSVGSVALFAAFFDGTLHDALTGSARFAAVETPLGWRDEWMRYSFLLSNEPMGSYAKRAVVLVALVSLIWFVVLWVAGRARSSSRTPTPFALIGWSFALGLVALWVTTSKWTHHFGVLAAAGPLIITAVLLAGPSLARGLLAGRRIPGWLPVLVAASFIPAIVLSLRGYNVWAYSWDAFMYGSGAPPAIAGRALGYLPLWGLVFVAALGITFLVARRRRDAAPTLYAAAGVVLVFSVVSTGFLYGTFGNAAVRGLSSYSPGAADLRDPAGTSCLPEKSIDLWDATRGTELRETDATGVRDLEPSEGRSPFHPATEMLDNGVLVEGEGLAQTPPPDGAGEVWSSAADQANAGATESPWYQLPSTLSARERVAVLVGGRASSASGNGVLLQVGSIDSGVVTVTREIWLTDTAERPGWRTLASDIGDPDLTGSPVVRAVGVDSSATPGSWFGFGTPRVVEAQSMEEVAGDDPSLVAWQSSFWFPCARPIRIADGVIEAPAYATTWGNDPPDNIWVDRRGGALAGVARIAQVSTPASEMAEVGSSWGRVVLFDYPYPTDGFRITKQPVTVSGLASPFGLPSQLMR